jgi:hypothetical protein
MTPRHSKFSDLPKIRTPHRERERSGACDFATSFTQSIKACFSNLNILLCRRIAGMGIGERSCVRLRDSS